ncbi:30S ribosomal protein S20 [candidate division WOR-3 bacterium]|nr:30S ribosomal protein S20 [candidate division WOR-3 bacterium]
MPHTRSAKKRLRQSIKRRELNKWRKGLVKGAIKQLMQAPPEEKPKYLRLVYSMIDRAVKKGVFHPNKGARLKSKYARMVAEQQVTQ